MPETIIGRLTSAWPGLLWSEGIASVVTPTFVSHGRLFRGFGPRTLSRRRVWVGIVVSEVFHDGALELGDAFEGATANAVSSDLGEEALDHVEPGSRGRREVQIEARMRLEPALYGRRLMGGIAVDDQVEVETGRGAMIDQLEKAQELSMPVRGIQVPITLPSSILRAANRVVVPLRL